MAALALPCAPAAAQQLTNCPNVASALEEVTVRPIRAPAAETTATGESSPDAQNTGGNTNVEALRRDVDRRRHVDMFWERRYRPFGAASAPGNAEDDAALLRLIQKTLTLGDEPATDNECGRVREELLDAATWSLIALNRRQGERARSGSGNGEAIGAANALAEIEARICETRRRCIWAAQLALLRAEQSADPEAAATALAAGRQAVRRGFSLETNAGPDLSGAEAWMVLAQFSAAPDGNDAQLNPADVRRAVEALRADAQFSTGETTLEGVPNVFRRRILPIYQAAADEAHDRAGNNKSAAIAELIEIGEASRRAQIELSLGDGCEPLETALRPEALRAGEVIFYPVVGRQRTYLLVGRTAGWELLDAIPGSDAESITALSNDLLLRLQTAIYAWNEDTGTLHPWGQEVAEELNAQLVRPLFDQRILSALAGDAQSAPTLIVFPDPVLRNVPWALLQGPGHGPNSYLVDHAAIAVGPALSYVRPADRPGRRSGWLAGGVDATEADELASFVARLNPPEGAPSVTGGRRAPDPTILDEFTSAAITSNIGSGRFSEVLLATHAEFRGGQGRLYVASEGADHSFLSIDEFQRGLQSGQRRVRGLDLLILVACESAAGDAGQLGLAGIALRGGAASTFGTVVQVSTAAAPNYFALTHDEAQFRREQGGSGNLRPLLEHYYDGLSPAQALRRVQREARRGGGDWGHPYNWGSMVLIGNWR